MNNALSIFGVIHSDSRRRSSHGFTLIEILAASLASALILLAVYGIFQRALKTRDHATERTRQSRQRERAANTLRNDLRNGLISGGVLACTLEGGPQSQQSHFPGYLRFTTTTAKDLPGEAYGDVQQVEYYIEENAHSGNTGGKPAGTLVRAITRDLLSNIQNVTREEQLLSHVESLEVTFYDGQTWQESWLMTDSTSTLPQAVRVRLQQAASSEDLPPPPLLEITVPWSAQPWTATTTTTGTSAQ